MPETSKHNVSNFKIVYPRELALQLAHQERLEGPAKAFEREVENEFKKVLIETITTNPNIFKPEDRENIDIYKRLVNNSEPLIPMWQFNQAGEVMGLNFGLVTPNAKKTNLLQEFRSIATIQIGFSSAPEKDDESFPETEFFPDLKNKESNFALTMRQADFNFKDFLNKHKQKDFTGFAAYAELITEAEIVNLAKKLSELQGNFTKHKQAQVHIEKKSPADKITYGLVLLKFENEINKLNKQIDGLKIFSETGYNFAEE